MLALVERAREESRARALAVTAYRVRVLRLAAGHDEEESVEAEAGALLEGETALEIHSMHTMMASYIEALNNSAPG